MSLELLPGCRRIWDDTRGDPRVCVAILDGPVDRTHPTLRGARLAAVPTLAGPAADGSTAARHGTHVASLVFGQPGTAVTGLAPRCRGLVVPIYRTRADGAVVPCSELDLARAIAQAVAAGADVINLSGGQPTMTGLAHPLLAGAVRECVDRGVLIVAAAGNDGCECVQLPAALPGVLPVGAMGADGEPLWFSNWGAAYRPQGVLAPGRDILGAASNGGTAYQSGTSQAAALVSGAAALLLSLALKNGRRLRGTDVRDALARTADRPSRPGERHRLGRLNVSNATTYLFPEVNTMSDLTPPAADGAAHPLAPLAPPGAGAAAGTRPAVVPAACGCGGSAPPAGAGFEDGGGDGSAQLVSAPRPAAPYQLVYALGQVGFDFETVARRDAFAQGMARPDGREPDPYNPQQLLAYLNERPWEAAGLTWTLSIDGTPIYALVPQGPYADEAHRRLREFFNQQMYEGAERVSIPGVIVGQVRLASGQVVPAVAPELRGMFNWTTAALADLVVGKLPADPTAAELGAMSDTERKALADQQDAFAARVTGLTNFFDRVYYELRNLGIMPQDRATNFAATNAFSIGKVFEKSLQEKMELDTIEVERSPYCRPESDCWDVKLLFFYPERQVQTVRRAYRYTVDVSDVVPVTVGPVRAWFVR